MGCPIRKSPDLRLFAPTRGLSQLITPFIVSMCLGIPRTPLVALPKCCLSWRWLGYIESPDWVIQSFQFPNCQKAKILCCGADRDRTCDLLNANQALSQLSYSPIYFVAVDQVGLRGLEPRTSSLSGMRSNHLSYKPILMKYSSNQKFSKKHYPL